jgi:hypothetical protein
VLLNAFERVCTLMDLGVEVETADCFNCQGARGLLTSPRRRGNWSAQEDTFAASVDVTEKTVDKCGPPNKQALSCRVPAANTLDVLLFSGYLYTGQSVGSDFYVFDPSTLCTIGRKIVRS